MKDKIVKEKNLSSEEISEFKKVAKSIRNKILEVAVHAGSGHIAPSFSCVEILVILYYGGILNFNASNPNWPKRDRFILSKGHATLALYVILANQKFFPLSDLDGFVKQGSCLGCHPENSISGIEVYTGSLGHGLPIAAGLALGAKLDNEKHLNIVLMGDGECHEGSVWEAAMFAAHHQLNNLIAIIDHNGLSATGILKNYLEVDPLKEKWEAFGWETVVVDGHSLTELFVILKSISLRRSDKPLAIIAVTTKGKGVSFMENNPIWHYRVPKGEELKIARKELDL